jgi:hypothetical protein
MNNLRREWTNKFVATHSNDDFERRCAVDGVIAENVRIHAALDAQVKMLCASGISSSTIELTGFDTVSLSDFDTICREYDDIIFDTGTYYRENTRVLYVMFAPKLLQ